ncbi:hypothetical protein [Nonomuraea angiospora]
MKASIEGAREGLAAALASRPLVSVERFASALRTSYTGPAADETLRPALSIGCYAAWDPASPAAVLAAERTTRVRSVAERHAWLARVQRAAAQQIAALDRPPVITGWYATPELRDLAGPHGTVAAIDGALRATIEAKPDFDALLRDADVPAAARIPCTRINTRLPSLAKLRRTLATDKVVVQSGVTSGGRGTVIVTSDDDMQRAARLPTPYRVTAFIDGWSSNVTVLSVPDGDGGVRVYVDRPSHKSVGVAELAIGSAKSAGNDWSRPWPTSSTSLLVECAERIAAWAWRKHRMAGLFGLDSILTPDGRVFLNEINARNQGTTEVSAVNQQQRGMPPFVTAHLVVMLGGRVNWLGDHQEFNHATITRASEPGGPFYVKARLTGDSPARIVPGHPPGVYQLGEDNLLRWMRPGAHPADADTDQHEVLLANLPTPDIVCHPGAEIATIEGITSGSNHPFDGPCTASPFTRRVFAALNNLFNPQPQERLT